MATLQEVLDASKGYREELRKAQATKNNLIAIAKINFIKAKKAAREKYISRIKK